MQQTPQNQPKQKLTADQVKKYKDKHYYINFIVWSTTLTAIAYIWSQELLFRIGFSNAGNTEYLAGPVNGTNDYSLSEYISTPQATGGMAMAFFFPVLFMWQAPGEAYKG